MWWIRIVYDLDKKSLQSNSHCDFISSPIQLWGALACHQGSTGPSGRDWTQLPIPRGHLTATHWTHLSSPTGRSPSPSSPRARHQHPDCTDREIKTNYKPIQGQCGRTDSVGTLGVVFYSYFPFICSIYPITGFYVSFSVRYFRFSLFVHAFCQHYDWHSVISRPASNSSLSIGLSPINFPNLYSILFSKQFSKMMLS